ncbi:hypothetical protein [Flagellimonas nanhaiensis]|uniref:hypothetical protein n=1 Tax=Flagellimonas nanhaiensis TaxID=2292706 RepID=UPI0015F29223|nr:hypothetical protein [Allomuricauda nanhaiensis]
MKKLVFVLAMVAGALFVSCEAESTDEQTLNIDNIETNATGKDGGSSTGDKDGDN